MTVEDQRMEASTFRTSDLAFAAYLRVNGMRHFTMEVTEFPDAPRADQAHWVYMRTPRSKQLQLDYERGFARTEPRAYAKALAKVRRELYAFLEMEDSELGHP
jgi:hypothetical protein